jgi:alkylation response protein AidB-like acyl-CoA dehydrogenase
MIDLLPSPEQELIIDTARALFAERFPMSALIGAEPVGHAEAEGLRAAGEAGLIAVAAPEQMGGSGYGVVEACLVLREAGRALAPVSVLAGAIASQLAVSTGSAELVGPLAAGEAEVAIRLGSGAITAGAPSSRLVLGWTLEAIDLAEAGEVEHVLDGVDPGATLCRRARKTVVATGGVDQAAIATLYSASVLSGLAEAARDSAVEYAKIRTQFGQPIGAFQAIKHICADMALRAEAAHFAVNLAALKMLAGEGDAFVHVTAAKVVATNAALANAAANVQVHGGIGFTSECEAHLFVKRANLLEQIAGSNAHHKSQLGLLRTAA